jgi:glutamyl-tRNA reductase
LVVDLGVPRNVETEARQLVNRFLHDVDTLESLIAQNLKRRREELPLVQEILSRELVRFNAWAMALNAEPVVTQLQKNAEAIRQREVSASLTRLPVEHHAEVERLSRALVKKLLHHPSSQLRGAADNSPDTLRLVRQLFQLDSEDRD